jgi:hypothetical protein
LGIGPYFPGWWIILQLNLDKLFDYWVCFLLSSCDVIKFSWILWSISILMECVDISYSDFYCSRLSKITPSFWS